jgi:hypothetical protein
MAKELIIINKEITPSVTWTVDNFNYNSAVIDVRDSFGCLKKDTTEFAFKLKEVREILRAQGRRSDLTSGHLVPKSWEEFCKDSLGVSKRTANRWLDRWYSIDKLEEAKKLIDPYVGDPIPIIYNQGYEFFNMKCDLLITDPPYMTDIDDINKFAKDWLPGALTNVKSTGSAFVFIGACPYFSNG